MYHDQFFSQLCSSQEPFLNNAFLKRFFNQPEEVHFKEPPHETDFEQPICILLWPIRVFYYHHTESGIFFVKKYTGNTPEKYYCQPLKTP